MGTLAAWHQKHEAAVDARMAELNARMGLREKSRTEVDGVIRVALERIPEES